MKKGYIYALIIMFAFVLVVEGCSSKNLQEYSTEYFSCKYDNTLLQTDISSDEDTIVFFDINDDASYKTIHNNSSANKITIDRVSHFMSDPITAINDEDKIIRLVHKVLNIRDGIVNETTNLQETYVEYFANIENTNYTIKAKLQRTQEDKITIAVLQCIESDEPYIKALEECFDNLELKKCIAYNPESKETDNKKDEDPGTKNEKETEPQQELVATPEPTPTSAPATLAPATPKPTQSAESVSNMLAETRGKLIKENYGYVDYDEFARNPNAYKDKSLTYEGEIVQIAEDSDTLAYAHMVYVRMRLAVGGNYNHIVWVEYLIGSNDSRFLENDYVQVYGKAQGLYTYTSTMGKSITIPSITADLIERK